ncbi:MAG: tetratricopeptide repeat protein [Phycisphaerales bacterium JB037]
MPSLEQLHRLLEADPHDPFTLYAIAQEHAKQGEHAQAIAFYDRCLAANPDECYAYFHKARSQEAMGDESDAAATLEAGIAVATRLGDAKALGELSAYREELA